MSAVVIPENPPGLKVCSAHVFADTELGVIAAVKVDILVMTEPPPICGVSKLAEVCFTRFPDPVALVVVSVVPPFTDTPVEFRVTVLFAAAGSMLNGQRLSVWL